jgi:hypothetical protein
VTKGEEKFQNFCWERGDQRSAACDQRSAALLSTATAAPAHRSELTNFKRDAQPHAYSFSPCSESQRHSALRRRQAALKVRLLHAFKELAVDLGDFIRRDFGLTIVSEQAINLLLDIGQLRVTEPCQKFQLRNSVHEIPILLD